ncbi:retrovirus-related pol polyprotein from transposon TNT 1-94 [Tanacetum coccineum]
MIEQDSPSPAITAMKIPIIKKGENDIWSMRMRLYICHTDHNLWDIIVDGDLQEEDAPAGEQSGPPAPKTAKQLTAKRNQERVKSILLLVIPDEYLLKFHNVPDAKSLWAAIKSSLDKAYDRFQKLISQLEVHAAPVSNKDINQKFLRRSMKNLAFLSSENTSSTNEVSTTSGNFGVNTARGTSLTSQVSSTPGADEVSKVECYNCHKKGHFAKECKSGRNQGKRSYGDNGRRNATTNEPSSQALVAQDGLGGYDWSNDFDEPVNYALMAISSSSSLSSSDNEGYELALEFIESRILRHEKNELAYGEKYEFQNYELNQMSAKDKNGLGYGTQLDKMSNKSETDSEISMSVFEVRSSDEELTPANDRFSKADSCAKPKINRDKVIIEDWNSDDEDDVYAIKTVSPVKNNETQMPQARRTFVPSGVLTRTGLVNLVRPNGKRAVHIVSTARPISTVRLLHARLVINMTTAGTRAVVNTGKGKMDNDLKKSRWVWRPKGNYMDHESKEKGSFILKKFEYVDPKGISNGGVVCSSHMTGNKLSFQDYKITMEALWVLEVIPKEVHKNIMLQVPLKKIKNLLRNTVWLILPGQHLVLPGLVSAAQKQNIASAVICLATNQKFNFSKLIFDGMLRNLDNTKKKFLMYPRFLMVFLNNQIELGEPFNDMYPTPAHNLKVFTNIFRKGLKFLGKITPLYPNMLTHAAEGEASRDSLEETNGNEGDQVQTPHDSPLLGSHTSNRAEGALNLQELSVLCTNLSNRVLALESIKDAQTAEISALNSRIKKLEKKCKPSISHHRAWLTSVKRLSMKKRFGKKESVSKQGRKTSKPESTLDDSTVFDDQDADHGMEYMDTKEAVDEGRQSGETEEVKLTDDTEVVEDKGSGDKGENAKELVSTARPKVNTARPDIDAARQEDSAVEPRTPPTTTNVNDSSRPARSILTLKPLPTIDPKDKGKGVLKESPVKKFKRSDLDAAQIAKDAEIARLIHEKELAEMEREREERQR